MVFDYFSSGQEEQFQFFRIPKKLVSDPSFSVLSTDARFLYGLLLDRTSLSRANNWVDGNNHVYIIYKVKDIMNDMACANGKVAKLLSELINIGLIERYRVGMGTPDIIYVKNFASFNQLITPITPVNLANSSDAKIAPLEMRKSHHLKCENRTTRDAETKSLVVRKSHRNINTKSYTDLSHTESIYPLIDGQIDDSIILNDIKLELLENKAIPFYYNQDERRMTAAVHLLTNWSEDYYLYDGFEEDSEEDQQAAKQRQAMFDTFNDCIVDMMCAHKSMHLLGSVVTYANVIDLINSHIRTDKAGKLIGLLDLPESCVNHLINVVNTRKVESTLPYLKSTIWTYLKSYKVTSNINYSKLQATEE